LSQRIQGNGNERHGSVGIGMSSGDISFALRALAAVFAAVLTLGLPIPASAGLFDDLFGGLTRPVATPAPLPVNVRDDAEPSDGVRHERVRPARHTASAPYSAQCVRTCDGYHFPVHAQGSVSAADMCSAFCPGSRTEIYSGNDIAHAVAADGSRYRDLPTAFLYRKRLVAGCTCNGHNPFGLAHIDVNTDPSLRRGDVVATRHGLQVFTGKDNDTADFTPVDSYRGFSKSYLEKLSQLKVTPPQVSERDDTPVTLPLAADARRDESRRAQLYK
jgi:Protein of unknown function (DUF2865)